MEFKLTDSKEIDGAQIIALYKKYKWSSASKPVELINALKNSYDLVSAWEGDKLIGSDNSISDGYLAVYYPHLLVHPDYQGKGVGKMIIGKLMNVKINTIIGSEITFTSTVKGKTFEGVMEKIK